MRSFWLLWSAILRMAKQTMSAWRAVVAVMMLCLMVAAGCDVRPFSELFGNDSEEETDADGDTGTGGDTDADDDEEPDSEALEFTPVEIETSVNTPGTAQVTVVNGDAGRTYTYEFTTKPDNGEADIDNNGLITFTPNPGFDGSDNLVVRVTDDGSPARSGSLPISITVTPE